MASKIIEFESFDGKTVRGREWISDNPKGLLQISHGMAEHTERYEEFASFMAENGYIVFADDHRGHGMTDNDLKGYTKGDMFNDTLKDMAKLTKIYKEKYPSLPLVLFGHSYGSFLTQSYIEKYGDNLDGVIIGGSAYMKDLSVTFGKVVSGALCAFKKQERPAELIAKLSFGMYNKQFSEGTFISSMLEECLRYDATDGCGFTLSNGFYYSFFKALPKMYKRSSYKNINCDMPILLISGSNDPVGKMGKSVDKLYKFYKETVGVKRVEKIIYDGVRHEYLNDIKKEDAYRDIKNFIDGTVNGI